MREKERRTANGTGNLSEKGLGERGTTLIENGSESTIIYCKWHNSTANLLLLVLRVPLRILAFLICILLRVPAWFHTIMDNTTTIGRHIITMSYIITTDSTLRLLCHPRQEQTQSCTVQDPQGNTSLLVHRRARSIQVNHIRRSLPSLLAQNLPHHRCHLENERAIGLPRALRKDIIIHR